MALGPIAVALIVYFKGRNDGYSKSQGLQRDAKDKLDSDIKQIEKQNQDLEREADETVDKLHNPNILSDELIRLWAERGYGGGKAEDPRTTKKDPEKS